MDQFEAARLKHAKNLERKLRTQGNEEPAVEAVEIVEVPSEKEEPVTGAIIRVKVTLPSGDVEFTFTKPGVGSVSVKDIKRGIEEGLRPVLGGVREL